MNKQGSEFARFLGPIVAVLREMGGSGTTAEVTDRAIEYLKIPPDEQAAELESGASRVRNQVQWARLYLVRGGLLDASRRGVWTLTDKASSLDLSSFDFESLRRKVSKQLQSRQAHRRHRKEALDLEDSDVIESDPDYRTRVLDIVRSISPSGFERLCQRLLRESGFEQVSVTGRSGDGGIDGVGVLQINPFVSFSVLFQCKRYQGSVTPSQVRDFRGAMMGRADKGIIITTGSFTVEAKKEARRDGVPPIELVAGEDLVRLFESRELGLKALTTYIVDESFFEDFE